MTAATPPSPADVFAVDFATLAREIAMDIFPVEEIVKLHKLSDEEWTKIQLHPKFIEMLQDMQRDWNSARSTKERVKIKAQTGLESMLEVYINDIADREIPLNQRVEAGKFLARIGELENNGVGVGGGGGGVKITINVTPDAPPLIIDATPVVHDEAEMEDA